jgi:hypothetical protein
MAKELSEQLADISAQAKQVEDAFAGIAEETDAKAAERRDKTRAAATAAVDHLDKGATAVGDSVAGHWRALQTKVQSEITGIQDGIADRQHARDVDHAQQQATAAENRAEWAVAFAAAAIQTAGLAVLDAGVARREAAALQSA